VLRRVADHLFWAARYVERAEWRARLADVNYHLLVEGGATSAQSWAVLLAITGEAELFSRHYDTAEEEPVLNFLAFDDRNSSSIRCCIDAARSNLHSLRHLVSSELWLEINSLYLDSRAWSFELFETRGVYAFFQEIKGRFWAVAGICESTLPRDPTYDFWQLGLMLERADNVSRLLDVKYHLLLPGVEAVGGPIDLLQWAAVLRSASGLEAYRRIWGNSIRIDRVVQLLLFDPTFPRSARFCVDRMENALERIANFCDGNDAPRPIAATGNLARILSERGAREVIIGGLHEFLLDLQKECARVGDSLFEEYLRFE